MLSPECMSRPPRGNPLRILLAGLVLAACGCAGLREPARQTVEIVGGRAASRAMKPYCFDDAIRDAGKPPVIDGDRHQTEVSGELRGPLRFGLRELLIVTAVSVPSAMMCVARPEAPADPSATSSGGELALDQALRRQ